MVVKTLFICDLQSQNCYANVKTRVGREFQKTLHPITK